MKTTVSIGAAACAAAFAAVSALNASAAAIDMSGYSQGCLSPMSQKSFEDLRDLTDRRIAEIRATPNMNIPQGSEVRYVSANGNDNNDGKSESTPWKTLGKLTYENLNPGPWWNQTHVKYVRFRRGDVFRGQLLAQAGVTYTAYGTGPKPCIYASPANGANPKLWTPTNAPNVWCYHIGTNDVGTIVFDGGREHAIKIVPYYHTNATAAVKFTQQYTGEPFTNGYKDLSHDLLFWHDYKANTKFKPHAKGSGIIYLYSEKGNPGSRFKSIEFCIGEQRNHVIDAKRNDNVTIDNLCIKYAGAHGISGSDSSNPNPLKNLKVTNCELGWIGGSIQWENNAGGPTRFGNAVEIYGGCDNFVVDNCYVYQVYDAGLSQQFNLNTASQVMDQKNIRYSNNVIECCNYSIEYFLGNVATNNTSHIENFTIVSNLMWDAGTGLCQMRPNTNEAAHVKSWGHSNRAKNYYIRDNVFARSKKMLIHVNSARKNSDGSDSMPTTMSGNVFIGDRGQYLGIVNQGTEVWLRYNDAGVSKLCERYPENYFFTEPKRKYSLWAMPPGPHVER